MRIEKIFFKKSGFLEVPIMLFSKLIKKIKFEMGVFLYNYGYRLLNSAVVHLNRGIHPKHHILKYYKYFTEHLKAGDRVLDLGCGNGFLTFKIAAKVKQVVAVDNNKASISSALSRYSKSNINYLLTYCVTIRIAFSYTIH